MRERRNDLEITNEIPQNCFCRSQTRINLLFTMSDITHAAVHPDCACELMFRGRLFEAPSIFDFIWWSQTGSNQLSYKPLTREAAMARNQLTPDASHKR